ncbi:MAG: hypothetical protein NPIRA04_06400 [Nitrospirales bacterium]|nr:MAG: hypothetical protein NPIRA04_06400 [Nitrospirales bacterium]
MMKRYSIILFISLIAMGVSSGSAWALFESKKELVNTAKITMAEAIEAAVKTVPGKAVAAEIDTEDDRTVFEVEIIDSAGKTKEVYIDGQTGEARKVESE